MPRSGFLNYPKPMNKHRSSPTTVRGSLAPRLYGLVLLCLTLMLALSLWLYQEHQQSRSRLLLGDQTARSLSQLTAALITSHPELSGDKGLLTQVTSSPLVTAAAYFDAKGVLKAQVPEDARLLDAMGAQNNVRVYVETLPTGGFVRLLLDESALTQQQRAVYASLLSQIPWFTLLGLVMGVALCQLYYQRRFKALVANLTPVDGAN